MKKSITAKIISLSLAATIALGALAGCANADKPTDKNSSGGGTTTTDGEKAYVVRILTPETDNPYIKLKDRETYPVYQKFIELMKKNGVELEMEIVARDQYQVVVQTKLASASDLPDYLNLSEEFLDETTVLNLAQNKTLLPLNKILEEHGNGTALKHFTEIAPFAAKSTTMADGNFYWAPSTLISKYEGKLASTCQMIAIRMDWLEKLNLKEPTNAQEFVEVMKAFRDQDANGNGIKDEALAFDPSKFANGIAQWFGLGVDITSVDLESKKIVSPWYQEGAKEYFKFMNNLVKEQLLDTTLVGAATSDLKNQKMAENKAGATYTYAMQAWLEPSIKGAENPQFLPIGPLPAMDGVTPINAIEPPEMAWMRYGVTKACKDPAGIAKMLDTYYSEEAQLLTVFGTEGETYDVVDGVPKKRLDIIDNNSRWEEASKDKLISGAALVGAMFPTVRNKDMADELSTGAPQKVAYQKKVMDYKPVHPDNPKAYFAPPSVDQLEKKADIATDLITYSKELATNLILGNESLDNWDIFIKELQKLGLDEYISIEQDQLDRFMNN